MTFGTWEEDLLLNIIAEMIGVAISIIIVYAIVENRLKKQKEEETIAKLNTIHHIVCSKLAEIRTRFSIILNSLKRLDKSEKLSEGINQDKKSRGMKPRNPKKDFEVSLKILEDKEKELHSLLDYYSINLQDDIEKLLELDTKINSVIRALKDEEYFSYYSDDFHEILKEEGGKEPGKNEYTYYKAVIEMSEALFLMNDIFVDFNQESEKRETEAIIKILTPLYNEVNEKLGHRQYEDEE